MKHKRRIMVLLALISIISLSFGCGKKEADLSPADQLSLSGFGSAGALMDDELTLEKMLNYALQDEYAARAEYEAILDAYGEQSPFDNIMAAEENHIASLLTLYAAYGYAVPEDTSAEHVVVPSTLLQAYQTGVDAEIMNIDMYEKFLTYDIPDDVAQVFTSLMDASENHLAAFRQHL